MPPPSPAEPLTAVIHTEDATRFAAVFNAAAGKPTAAELQRGYLAPGSYGVQVFTPHRIRDAAWLADAVARDPALYRRAIDVCLPQLPHFNADLRSIYLGLHGLYPHAALPQIFVVFGAGNSGGTADAGAQVLGLERVCDMGNGTNDLRRILRRFSRTKQYTPCRTMLTPMPSRACWAMF